MDGVRMRPSFGPGLRGTGEQAWRKWKEGNYLLASVFFFSLPGLLMLIRGRNSVEREIGLGICIQTQAAASGFVIGLLM